MKLYLFVLMFLIGIVLAVHLSMNAQVGLILKNPKMGNALFWCIGGVTALLIGFSNWDVDVFQRLKEVPVWLLTAGVIGAALVFGIAWIIPQIGAAPAFVLMVAGQVVAGLVVSHFGLLGAPVEPITLTKVIGVLLLVAGVSLVSFTK
jgi:transporter family-2 protein